MFLQLDLRYPHRSIKVLRKIVYTYDGPFKISYICSGDQLALLTQKLKPKSSFIIKVSQSSYLQVGFLEKNKGRNFLSRYCTHRGKSLPIFFRRRRPKEYLLKVRISPYKTFYMCKFFYSSILVLFVRFLTNSSQAARAWRGSS
jgi:hypothetical protein